MMRPLSRFLPVALACAGLSIGPPAAVAQDVGVPSLKAAFLANFVKFAEWPEDAVPAGRVFTFCVAGDKRVAWALEQVVKQHHGPAVSVMSVTPEGALRSCQLLYLGDLDLRRSRKVLESLRGVPVFTVSDVDGFAEMGGVAQLRFEQGRMRFGINPAAAQRARLTLSGKLLSLAVLVKDGDNEGR
jgi:hypothetical protein